MINILIISTNALGDTYLSASAIAPIRSAFKNSRIDFISLISHKFMMDHLSVDNHTYLKKKNIFSLLGLLLLTRRQNYDLVFSFFPGIVNTLIFYSARSKKKIGFTNFIRRNQWYNKQQRTTIKGIDKTKFIWKPAMNYMLRVSQLIQLAGIECFNICKPLFPYDILGKDESKINYIVIHFKSRNENRSISDEDVLVLCESLKKKCSYKILLIGTEKDFSSKLKQMCNENNIDIIKDAKLSKLLSILLNSKLFIGIDSFPLHVADAYNTNFIGIFGPTNPDTVLVNSGKSIIMKYDKHIRINFEQLIEELETLLS
jgi:ADP-heptose:LPS heptosyltransferase